MKKVLILILPIVLIMGVANAQTDSCVQNANLKREKFRLAFDTPNSSVLEKEALRFLLSEDQFSAYNHARRCFIASVFLLSAAAIPTSLGGYFLIAGYANTNLMAVIGSFILFGYASLGIIPGVILITHSAKKLNGIALDYNNQRLSSYYQRNVQLNFGFTQNGIGFKLNF